MFLVTLSERNEMKQSVTAMEQRRKEWKSVMSLVHLVYLGNWHYQNSHVFKAGTVSTG